MVTGHRELVKKWIFGQDLYQDLTNVLVDTQIHALKRKSGVIVIQVNEKSEQFLGHYIYRISSYNCRGNYLFFFEFIKA